MRPACSGSALNRERAAQVLDLISQEPTQRAGDAAAFAFQAPLTRPQRGRRHGVMRETMLARLRRRAGLRLTHRRGPAARVSVQLRIDANSDPGLPVTSDQP
jgi:hypothetical protein